MDVTYDEPQQLLARPYSPDVLLIACCDRPYGRPSLRAVGSTLRGVVPYGTESSRKPVVLGYRLLRRTVQVRLGTIPRYGYPVARLA